MLYVKVTKVCVYVSDRLIQTTIIYFRVRINRQIVKINCIFSNNVNIYYVIQSCHNLLIIRLSYKLLYHPFYNYILANFIKKMIGQ